MPTSDHAVIDPADILRIAKLSYLELSEEELARMAKELGSILAYVKQLQEIDVSDVLPTAHVQIERAPLREDEPHPSLAHDLALREAPSVLQDGFAVPAFVDEG